MKKESKLRNCKRKRFLLVLGKKKWHLTEREVQRLWDSANSILIKLKFDRFVEEKTQNKKGEPE